MAGNFNDKREKADWTDESDEFDLDAELAGLSSFLEEMGVQLEEEDTGDEVTGDVSFDFSDEVSFPDPDDPGLPMFPEDEPERADSMDPTEEPDIMNEWGSAEEPKPTNGIDPTEEPDFMNGVDSTEEPDIMNEWDLAEEPKLMKGSDTAYGPKLTSGAGTAYVSHLMNEPEPTKVSDAADKSDLMNKPGSADETNPAADAVFAEEFDLIDDFYLADGIRQAGKSGLEDDQTAVPGIVFPDDFASEIEPDQKEKAAPDVDDRDGAEEREKRRRAEKEVDRVLIKTFGRPFSWKREVLSWVAMFVIAFALAFIIDNYLIVNATVPTGSMQNTIMAGDRMIGWRLSYLFSDPERGDIIIFEYPDNPEEIYVKRVIGLPGETVTITNGEIYINDSTEPLEEDYLPEEWVWKNDGYTFVVPEDSYLCLGDNRNNSHDARSWTNTYVTKDAILGQAVLCYWPTDDFGWLN